MDRWQIRELRDPEEKREAAQTVLTALPEWFGLPYSTAAYIRDCGSLPVWAAAEAGTVAGFIALKRTSDYAGEVFVMGVLPQNHRRGLGRALLQTLEARARQEHMLLPGSCAPADPGGPSPAGAYAVFASENGRAGAL